MRDLVGFEFGQELEDTERQKPKQMGGMVPFSHTQKL